MSIMPVSEHLLSNTAEPLLLSYEGMAVVRTIEKLGSRNGRPQRTITITDAGLISGHAELLRT
jgi:hypothetical protein